MNVVILWHMHQPYYVNPLTKKAMMPWVRLHAAKGYLDMIDLVTAQPELRVNFNFTPVLVRQILELVNGEVEDEWETVSRKPAAELDHEERRHLLENFFKINWDTLVRVSPRYTELLAKRGPNYTLSRLDAIVRTFTEADFRDLQTLYNLQWCGFSAVRRFPILNALKEKDRDFTEEDKIAVLDVHREILRIVLPEYRAASERGQIELTTTPYFHPIMPLVFDTHIARRCQPTSPLPSPFSAPEDVRAQLRLAQELHEEVFGKRARGLWPSEGSIAPEIVPLMVEAGFDYFCSDEGNIFKSLKNDPAWNTRHVDHLALFQGWRIHAYEKTIQALFRERPLSDFVGFDAARNETSKAVAHLIDNLKNIAQAVPERGVVPLILDGENAWEAFVDGGEAFLSTFYRTLIETPEFETSRLGDYFDANPSQVETCYLHSGSWIRSDFDIWIGDPEENKAWEWLKETRHFLVERIAQGNLSPDRAEKAWWEIYAAEGSDWFWWYGPDFTIDTDFLFDELFRLHLQNVYRILDIEPPAHLEVPICLPSSDLGYTQPLRLLSPNITDETQRFFNWLGAGQLDLTKQQTAMFQGDRIGQKLFFGFGSSNFYLRLDLSRHPEAITIRFLLPHPARVTLRRPRTGALETLFETSGDGVLFTPAPATNLLSHWGRSLNVSIPRELLRVEPGHEFAFFVQLLENGLQRERYPERGAIELTAPGKDFEAEKWFV
jgi:alpha-amylase/alpha-mannosidase (GH57 family)